MAKPAPIFLPPALRQFLAWSNSDRRVPLTAAMSSRRLRRSRTEPRIDNPLGLRNNFLCATFLKVGGAIS